MKSFAFEFKMVSFNEIHPDSKNIRTKHIPDEDHALKQSILANGLIQPFIVCNNPNGSGYLIVDGHRTFDACREIFKDSNPEVPVVVSSQEDGEFTEGQLRKARLLRDIHTQKLGDWDQLVAIKLHADDMREEHSGITDTEIAKTLGRTKSWLSKKLTAGNSGIFAPAIEMGKVSYGKSLLLKSAPVEAQKALIDATEDMTLHDTERIVQQVRMGVSVAEAIRTVELSKSEDPQLQVKDAEVKERFPEEDASQKLTSDKDHSPSVSETVHDGEGETTEEAVEKDDDSGRKSLQPPSPETTGDIIADGFAKGGGEKGTEGEEEEPERETCPTCNGNAYLKQGSAQVLCPNCHGKGFTLKEKGIEEAEPLAVAQSSLPEGGTDSHTPDVDPPTETKKKEPQVCAKVSNMEEMLQKLVNKPPKTFLATFKTVSHKGNFKNRVEGIHLWSGELVDLMESDLNGDSPFLCEIKRKRNAVMEILDRPKHSIIENERDKLDDLMDELKTKIEQDAKRGS